jgi:hypothetical protein
VARLLDLTGITQPSAVVKNTAVSRPAINPPSQHPYRHTDTNTDANSHLPHATRADLSTSYQLRPTHRSGWLDPPGSLRPCLDARDMTRKGGGVQLRRTWPQDAKDECKTQCQGLVSVLGGDTMLGCCFSALRSMLLE